MPTLPLVGDEFAGYRLRAVIGRGGMSVVFQAENPRLGNVVALKVLAPELASQDVFRTRFLHESRTAASLNHPNVVPIYDVGPCGDLLYIAMRYVTGTDLRALLKKERQIPPEKALMITGQVARALDAAHRRGLVHRDVKPGNILLEEETDDDPVHVYLADFGITKHTLSRSGLTSTGEFLGTIDYVAPEQIQGTPVDGRADQYSLGCVLYECLTGHVPFEKDLDAAVIWAHVEELPPMPSALRPDLPSGVDDVFGKVMAKKAADRYPSCREFVEAARVALAGRRAEPLTIAARRQPPDSAHASTPPPAVRDRPGGAGRRGRPAAPRGDGSGAEEPPRRRRGRRWIAALGALVLVIAAGVGGWLALHGNSGASPSGTPSSPAMGSNSPLMQALVQTNRNNEAKGQLPPSTCHAQGMTQVTCSNPAQSITSATFRTYPSLTALYQAYVTKVKSLSSGHFQPNVGNCSTRRNSGEVSWNHQFQHPRNFSIKQSESGMLDKDTQAAGRVFCTITNLYNLVWTQNDRLLLGWLSATDHQSGFNWWVAIHHNIPLGSGTMHMNS
jgi:serine/threonine protein kinase